MPELADGLFKRSCAHPADPDLAEHQADDYSIWLVQVMACHVLDFFRND